MRKTLTSAEGATTVPTSRPSATQSPSAISTRWAATIAERTPRWAETCDTAAVTSASRIRSVTSSPAMWTLTPSGTGASVTRFVSASSARAPSSSGSTPRASASHASARYIAPVSR